MGSVNQWNTTVIHLSMKRTRNQIKDQDLLHSIEIIKSVDTAKHMKMSISTVCSVGQNYSSVSAFKCSFCHESFLRIGDLGKHFEICANKTDRCPNCQKFVRRAIFAYHYENNCANVDKSDDESEPLKSKHLRIRSASVDSRSSRRDENEKPHYDDVHYKVKGEWDSSLLEFVEIENSFLSATYSIARVPVQTTDEELIPCEICDKKIPFRQYDTHTVKKNSSILSWGSLHIICKTGQLHPDSFKYQWTNHSVKFFNRKSSMECFFLC